ncbi:bidirectional hydrogenase complex protein HoxE [Oscillatoriales cyanobacterium USR001]|nr:bidirectional hydrogenase complex protein HoxE [Oscillatoriales cyanobacterium USR001]
MMETIATTSKSKSAKTSDHPSGDKRFKALEITMKRAQFRQDALIEVLHKAQEAFGYLEEDVLIYVARGLKLPLSQVFGVATFYHLFSLKPSGAHSCVVCLGTACYVKGGGEVMAALEKQMGIHQGETTADGQMSLLTARCIGACGIAPAVVFDGKVASQVTAEAACDRIKDWIK